MGYGNETPEELLERAMRSDQEGDVYTAVKLFRILLRKEPEWVQPFWELAQIYRRRREWKPLMHYSLCVLDREPGKKEAWQDLGLSATAMGKYQVARLAWNKLDYPKNGHAGFHKPESIALALDTIHGQEVVLADRIDPVQALVRSIPQPSSGYHYGDLILIDLRDTDRVIVRKEVYPVYRELERLKMAHTQTFSAILHTSDTLQLDFLRKLCAQRGLGFDNWSKSERQTNWTRPDGMEYYRELHEDSDPIAFSIVALAGQKATTALEVLRAWKQITLVDYNRLFRLG